MQPTINYKPGRYHCDIYQEYTEHGGVINIECDNLDQVYICQDCFCKMDEVIISYQAGEQNDTI
jgi:hypothetical protein